MLLHSQSGFPSLRVSIWRITSTGSFMFLLQFLNPLKRPEPTLDWSCEQVLFVKLKPGWADSTVVHKLLKANTELHCMMRLLRIKSLLVLVFSRDLLTVRRKTIKSRCQRNQRILSVKSSAAVKPVIWKWASEKWNDAVISVNCFYQCSLAFLSAFSAISADLGCRWDIISIFSSEADVF